MMPSRGIRRLAVKKRVVIWSFVLLSVAGLEAQTFTGTILGTVRDGTGSVVTNAKVTLINTGTQTKVSAETDESGGYTAALLPPGAYRLEVAAAGFRTYEQEG